MKVVFRCKITLYNFFQWFSSLQKKSLIKDCLCKIQCWYGKNIRKKLTNSQNQTLSERYSQMRSQLSGMVDHTISRNKLTYITLPRIRPKYLILNIPAELQEVAKIWFSANCLILQLLARHVKAANEWIQRICKHYMSLIFCTKTAL